MFFAGYWINDFFAGPTFEQILFSMTYESGGLATTDPELKKRAIKWCLRYPLLATLAFVSAEIVAAHLYQVFSERLHQYSRTKSATKTGVQFAPYILFLLGTIYFLNQLAIPAYAKSLIGEDYFKAHFFDPKNLTFQSSKPKNLVFIYVESLETSYRNKKLFSKDLLQRLDPAEFGGISFGSYNQTVQTGWTIGAEVATQCGLPLKVVLKGTDGNSQGEKIRQFLPNAKCLGDILRDHGYYNVFLQGASLRFAGQGLFWRQHGFHDVFGSEELAKLGYKAGGGWGVTDDGVLQHARKLFRELHSSGKKFNLTIALVDTHHADGILSEECKRRGVKNFVGIVECTAQLVSEFIQELVDQRFLDDTVLVVVGDHLAMKNVVYDKLTSTKRSIYNMFLAKDLPQPNRDEIIHYDLLPSTLSLLGFDWNEGRAGLGFSAFGNNVILPPKNRTAELNKSLMNQSHTYLNLW